MADGSAAKRDETPEVPVHDQPPNDPIVDVSKLSLKTIRELPETALADTLRRLFADLDSNAEPVAGFQSGI